MIAELFELFCLLFIQAGLMLLFVWILSKFLENTFKE